jgi:hypothetical protein
MKGGGGEGILAVMCVSKSVRFDLCCCLFLKWPWIIAAESIICHLTITPLNEPQIASPSLNQPHYCVSETRKCWKKGWMAAAIIKVTLKRLIVGNSIILLLYLEARDISNSIRE